MVDDLARFIDKAKEFGVLDAKLIKADTIRTGAWVRMKCHFGCSHYNASYCCPPHTPAPDVTRRVIDSYEKALLLQQSVEKGGRTKDFNEIVVRLEIEVFLDGYYKAWSMGSGPCRLCKTCDPAGLCQHGYEARPSMEACGIDVFKTARENGFPIEVVRSHEETRNIFGVILVE